MTDHPPIILSPENLSPGNLSPGNLSPGKISAEKGLGSPGDRTHLEPELGGQFRLGQGRSGAEPELGGGLRQKAVYVDEVICIGCKHCAHVAGNTFYIEPDYGRSRVMCQNGDPEPFVQEAIDTCPVDCIHWVDYKALKQLEADRQDQVIPRAGFPVDRATLSAQQRLKQKKRRLST